MHIPDTISEKAKLLLQSLPAPSDIPPLPEPNDQAAWDETHAENEEYYREANEQVVAHYRPAIESLELAGVPVLNILPAGWQDNGRVIVYLHGGGYTLHTAASTLISSVPVAADTRCRVVSVDYTCAPRAKWREILEQCIAVVTALRASGYAWGDIAVYGDSAGGSLAAGVVLKMRDQGLGMPAAVMLWSPWSDITEAGDTYHTLKEAEPAYFYKEHLASCALAYADKKDHLHPYVSPVYGDYAKGFPPTLIQGGTKEIFLSNFVRHYQALDCAGVPVKLDLYEGMVHVFQAYDPLMPESILARKKVRQFLQESWG